MDTNVKAKEEMLSTNERQKAFYNQGAIKKNLPTRIWAGIRNSLLHDFRKNFNISPMVYEQHKKWMGDLSDKRILDLGCLRGNALSLYMAENAKRYVGIDLSDVAIAQLQKKIDDRNCPNAQALAVDFLSDGFSEKDFDLIYAYGVLHHFENFDVLLDRLDEKLAPHGQIISYDPLETSRPIKLFRALYRPFQSDKDWEWPFTKQVIDTLYHRFEVKDAIGLLGKSKYGILLSFLPLSSNYKTRKIQKMIQDDWTIHSKKDIYPCMHLSLFMEKRKIEG